MPIKNLLRIYKYKFPHVLPFKCTAEELPAKNGRKISDSVHKKTKFLLELYVLHPSANCGLLRTLEDIDFLYSILTENRFSQQTGQSLSQHSHDDMPEVSFAHL